MKNRGFLISLILVFAAEALVLIIYAAHTRTLPQDTIAVNEAVQSVTTDWNAMETHINQTALDYVVIDADGRVRFRTRPGLSESVNGAIAHRDTICDLEINGSVVGKLIVWNDTGQALQEQKQATIYILLTALLLQFVIGLGYIFYANHAIVKPFTELKSFAQRVADGNLDIPLAMDRKNLFGAFTESFDLMRSELKKARTAEAEANASKKELVANLSHDIKTPVASIKAAAELGAVLTDDEKISGNYTQIVQKADQINTLVTNLFTSALEDLHQLSVMPADIGSQELKTMLENSDYLHRAAISDVPDCLLSADRLRLQQVFDNIFSNSYKYADTTIDVITQRHDSRLAVIIEDHGGGVGAEELPLLKEKFRRGSNTAGIEGTGLGLYISDYFMKEMQGELLVQNGSDGLRITVFISMSGAAIVNDKNICRLL